MNGFAVVQRQVHLQILCTK